jgi:predicted RNA-binding protein with RPS1 domain
MSDETSVAEATTMTAAQPDLTPEELVAAMETSFRDFKDGDIVEGDVVKIDRDEVLLDIGYKSEGVIPAKELSIRHDVKPAEIVQVGEHMEALVLQKEDKEGRLILSKKRAQYERAWGRIEQVMQSGQTIKGPVIEVVKGGLILDIGLRGFFPRRSSICGASATCSRSSGPSSSARSSSSTATATTWSSAVARSSRSRSPRAARPSCRTCRRASAARARSARS